MIGIKNLLVEGDRLTKVFFKKIFNEFYMFKKFKKFTKENEYVNFTSSDI